MIDDWREGRFHSDAIAEPIALQRMVVMCPQARNTVIFESVVAVSSVNWIQYSIYMLKELIYSQKPRRSVAS